MKKNLAKRIVLGLLTGAMLMSSSVAWAETNYGVYTFKETDNTPIGNNSFGVGYCGDGVENKEPGNLTGNYENSIVIGINSEVQSNNSITLGNNAVVSRENSVALGYGSVADAPNVVSVGGGNVNGAYATRKIVNVTKGEHDTDAVNVGQLNAVEASIKATIGNVGDFEDTVPENYVNRATNLVGAVKMLDNSLKIEANKIGDMIFTNNGNLVGINNLTDAVKKLDNLVVENASAIADVYTKTEADARYVKIVKDNTDPTKTTTSIGDFVVTDVGSSSTVTINAGADQQVVFDEDGITVGKHSTRMDGTGFYVWADGQNNNTTSDHEPNKAIASINDKGEIKAANGAFKVDANGNVIGGTYNGVDIRALADSVASNDAVAGLNQRLEKTNAKINKVGAGAAALAALHPLDYDPDDKLTFSAGMGNYAGENAAALGAFYRPNEKFMLSLGGTMGNGENMVNLGLSIGLDKPNGLAKLSKRELIQKVNAVEAENDALEDRVAKLEALVAQLASK